MNTRAEDLPVIDAVMAGVHAANQLGHRMASQAVVLRAPGIEPIVMAQCEYPYCLAAVVVQPLGNHPQFIDDSTFLYPCRGAE